MVNLLSIFIMTSILIGCEGATYNDVTNISTPRVVCIIKDDNGRVLTYRETASSGLDLPGGIVNPQYNINLENTLYNEVLRTTGRKIRHIRFRFQWLGTAVYECKLHSKLRSLVFTGQDIKFRDLYSIPLVDFEYGYMKRVREGGY